MIPASIVSVVTVSAVALEFGTVVIQKRRCPIVAIAVMVPDKKSAVETINTCAVDAADNFILGVENEPCACWNHMGWCGKVFSVLNCRMALIGKADRTKMRSVRHMLS